MALDHHYPIRKIRVSLVGKRQSGKTALRKRLINTEIPITLEPTQGHDVDTNAFDLSLSTTAPQDNKIQKINLEFWETGARNPNEDNVLFYAADDARVNISTSNRINPIMLIVLDINLPDTDLEEQLAYWNKLLDEHAPKSDRMVILQKCDQLDEPKKADIILRMQTYAGNLKVLACSATSGEGINLLTEALVSNAVKVINAQDKADTRAAQPALRNSGGESRGLKPYLWLLGLAVITFFKKIANAIRHCFNSSSIEPDTTQVEQPSNTDQEELHRKGIESISNPNEINDDAAEENSLFGTPNSARNLRAYSIMGNFGNTKPDEKESELFRPPSSARNLKAYSIMGNFEDTNAQDQENPLFKSPTSSKFLKFQDRNNSPNNNSLEDKNTSHEVSHSTRNKSKQK